MVLISIQDETMQVDGLDCMVIDQKKENEDKGFVAFDMQKRLLCYNEKATSFVPELEDKKTGEVFHADESRLIEVFYSMIDRLKSGDNATSNFSIAGTIFRCQAMYCYQPDDKNPSGYLVVINDVTAEQGYMNLIQELGQSLQKDIDEKTAHIRYIQQRVVLGMATIIENRDMNTGGHVKRTSDIIKILVDEMRRQGVGDLDDEYADEIIRSAPMHDLGKISIKNEILNKPGKLTDEEYKEMKTHSAKSGEIVKSILSGVEEPHFLQTAYCLARFHHERWDGKGYPERLAQQEIPLEARIMAVADVYDALVSKRCYKEPMSFEQAAKIMIEGMGSQFDPMMQPIFEACREQLEAYYLEHSED